MKKIVILLLALLIALGAAAVAESDLVGQAMPDFTVVTAEGGEITLSRLLEEKDLVVLNIFTSWCPPCRNEFPGMEGVYEEHSDRMEIVAVSGDPEDTAQIIADYKAELGLSFPMGPAEGSGIIEFVQPEGYPTTLFIDRNGKIAFFQLGMFMQESQFQDLVNYYLDDAYDGTPAGAFNVYVCDQDQNPVPGVNISFCTDATCDLRTSDENGIISFAGRPESYHLQILTVPEGFSFDADFEATCDGSGEWAIVQVSKD